MPADPISIRLSAARASPHRPAFDPVPASPYANRVQVQPLDEIEWHDGSDGQSKGQIQGAFPCQVKAPAILT